MRIKKAEHLCLLNYGPFYYVSLFFGVLPFKYDEQLLYTNRNSTGKMSQLSVLFDTLSCFEYLNTKMSNEGVR